MLNNYRIHILEVRHFEKTEVPDGLERGIWIYPKGTRIRMLAKRFTFQNEERFKELAEDAYDVISALTESGAGRSKKSGTGRKAGRSICVKRFVE